MRAVRAAGPVRERTRNRILVAAAEVIAAAGLHPWSMDSVAAKSEVTVRTVYRYFPTKTALIDALPELSRASETVSPRGAGQHREDDGPTIGRSRRLLLAAARELFGEKGFEATSVREIAERAGVTKLLVYRHFGSKAHLFQEATMDPIKEFMAEFFARWSSGPHGRRHVVYDTQDFYTAFCDVLEAQRDLLAPLVSTGPAEHGTGGLNNTQYLEQVFKDWFNFQDRVMYAETTGEGYREFDQALANRLWFGMALSVVLHGDWIFGPRKPSRDHLIKEMANLMVFGILKPARNAGKPIP